MRKRPAGTMSSASGVSIESGKLQAGDENRENQNGARDDEERTENGEHSIGSFGTGENFRLHFLPSNDARQNADDDAAHGKTEVAREVVEIIKDCTSGNLEVGQYAKGKSAETPDEEHGKRDERHGLKAHEF